MKFRLRSVFCNSKSNIKMEYNELFERFKDNIVDEDKWNYYIEINTLEELIELYKLVNKDIIIEKDTFEKSEDNINITIYDDYIE